MQSIFHCSWLQVDLNDQELRSLTGGKGWKPLQYLCRDNTSAKIHKCGKAETLGDEWKKKEAAKSRKVQKMLKREKEGS